MKIVLTATERTQQYFNTENCIKRFSQGMSATFLTRCDPYNYEWPLLCTRSLRPTIKPFSHCISRCCCLLCTTILCMGSSSKEQLVRHGSIRIFVIKIERKYVGSFLSMLSISKATLDRHLQTTDVVVVLIIIHHRHAMQMTG